MHITFIYPAVGRKTNQPYVRSWQMEPLAIALLSALTPNDIETSFYDDRLESIPYDIETDLVAISIETFTALRGYRIAEEFRKRGRTIVFGGYHATLVPDEARQHADAIVVGPAEPVWNQLLDDFQNEELQKVYSSETSPKDIDVTPDRTIFQEKDYLKVRLVEFSRGCRRNCEFCSIAAFSGRRQHARPAEVVAEEMRSLGAKNFFVVDDNVAGNRERIRELAEAIAPLNIRWIGQTDITAGQDPELLKLLKKSGCQGLLIGMESLDDANLKAMGKTWNHKIGNDKNASYAELLRPFKENNLAIYGTFLFGYQQDDEASIRKSVQFAIEQKLFLAAFNHLVPFPGTPVYNRLKIEERLDSDAWWLDPETKMGQVYFEPYLMSKDALEEACYDARKTFFGWKSIVKRLWNIKANFSSLRRGTLFLAVNAMSQHDIARRQGLLLGESPVDEAAEASHG